MNEQVIRIGNLEIAPKTPLIVGSRVVAISITPHDSKSNQTWILGNRFERLGTVTSLTYDLAPNEKGIIVEWDFVEDRYDSYTAVMLASNLINYEDYKAAIAALPVTPSRFKAGDVVYVKPDKRRGADRNYPAIGSPYESDIKIVEVTPTLLGSGAMYRLYAPRYGYITLKEEALLSRDERDAIKLATNTTARVTVNMAPLFNLNQIVIVNNGYICNESKCNWCKLTDAVRKNLNFKYV